MNWNKFREEQEDFEKWLIKYKGYQMTTCFCKNCGCGPVCGRIHDGGCLAFSHYTHARARLRDYSQNFLDITLLDLCDFFVNFAFDRSGNVKRLNVVSSIGFNLEKLFDEYSVSLERFFPLQGGR